MPDPIFERYKEALKAGHVAVLRGRSDEAIAHYREAAEIAPDRPLPHTSLGGVLVREGRLDEALAAYSRALGRAPREEAALSGRTEALLSAGRPDQAAEILERLADVQAKTDRRPEALVTLRRAEALESSRARRRRIKELEAIDAPLRPVRTRLTSRLPRPRARPVAVAPAAAEAGEAAADEVIAPGAPPDPETLLASANALLDDDRPVEAAEAYAAAAAAFERIDEPAAAFDACQRGLEAAPGSAIVHVELARLYLARGWRDRAADKLLLLDRLMLVAGDEPGHQAAVALRQAALADEPRIAAWLATAGTPDRG
ncbi:MAG: tetratricopeptide repeat protein [Candidatus Limnocylindrales bacterium]